MPATTKALTTILDAQIDPDSPLDTALLTAIRDSLVNIDERLGGSYTKNTTNHTHDGVDSALVPIGPNYLRNGSFEDALAGWTATAYTGGTVASSTSTNHDGAKSLAITSTVLANGGGDVLSNEFTPVTGGEYYSLYGDVSASVANVSSKIEIIWYDNAKAQISASLVYSTLATPTAFARVGTQRVAPATARFMRVKATGGVPALGTAVGTISLDGFVLGGAEALKPGDLIFSGNVSAAIGSLKANGAAVSRTAYPGLFDRIGTTFGVGDGTTTFNLPELRGEFVRSLADGRAVDTSRVLGSYQADLFASHAHLGAISAGAGTLYNVAAPTTTDIAPAYDSFGTASTGGAETRPRNVALLACIKY